MLPIGACSERFEETLQSGSSFVESNNILNDDDCNCPVSGGCVIRYTVVHSKYSLCNFNFVATNARINI